MAIDPGTTIDWGTLASASIIAGGLASVLTWIWGRGGKAALLIQQIADAKLAVEKAEARTTEAEKVNAELRGILNEHMLSDATSFAKLESIATEAARISVTSEARLTAALDNLGTRLDSLTKRFDDFMNLALKVTNSGGNGNGYSVVPRRKRRT